MSRLLEIITKCPKCKHEKRSFFPEEICEKCLHYSVNIVGEQWTFYNVDDFMEMAEERIEKN